MNCQDFEKLVLALARNRLLDAGVRQQGLAHTESCQRCAARLAEERALIAGMRAAVAELAEEKVPARVEAALLAAFRGQTAATASPTVVPQPRETRGWTNWKLAAVAAGILILISVMVIFWRPARSLEPQQEEQAVLPTPASTPGPQATPRKPAEPQVGRDQVAAKQSENRQNHMRRQAYRDDSDAAEEVTRFFPLREGEDLTTVESLRLVRVELPSSALSDVGLPVDPETANAPVKADVVLGHDGLARAIRFVR